LNAPRKFIGQVKEKKRAPGPPKPSLKKGYQMEEPYWMARHDGEIFFGEGRSSIMFRTKADGRKNSLRKVRYKRIERRLLVRENSRRFADRLRGGSFKGVKGEGGTEGKKGVLP